MVLDFMFTRRFNWFDTIVLLSVPSMIPHIGWWTMLVVVLGAIFSVSAEQRLKVN